jgi:capsid protein
VNVLSKLWARIKAGLGVGTVANRYEGAVPTLGSKSWLFGSVQDARFDADSATRTELVRKSRYFAKNSELYKKIQRVDLQFTVGPTGLQVIPKADTDLFPQWNDSRQHSWAAWAAHPEIEHDHSLRTSEITWHASLFVDGEFFVLKKQFQGRPYIQTVAAHRCKSPPESKWIQGTEVIDGIEFQSIGETKRITAYWFVNSVMAFSTYQFQPYFSNEDFKRIPAEEVIHRFEPLMVGQIRGIPRCHACINKLHDHSDLDLLEMRAAKKQAELPAVITNAAGEADVSMSRRWKVPMQSQDSSGNTVTKDRTIYYDTKFGGEAVYAKTGVTVALPASTRPSVVTQSYFDQLKSAICYGMHVPRLLVDPQSMQGTVVRTDIEVSANAFRFGFEQISSALREIYRWQTDWAIKYDKELKGEKPKHWDRCLIRPPRQCNVDIGRNANALALELKTGTVTFQDVFAERQQNWQDQFRQAAEAAFFLKKLARDYSKDGIEVTVDDIACKMGIPAVPEADQLPDETDGEQSKKIPFSEKQEA